MVADLRERFGELEGHDFGALVGIGADALKAFGERHGGDGGLRERPFANRLHRRRQLDRGELVAELSEALGNRRRPSRQLDFLQVRARREGVGAQRGHRVRNVDGRQAVHLGEGAPPDAFQTVGQNDLGKRVAVANASAECLVSDGLRAREHRVRGVRLAHGVGLERLLVGGIERAVDRAVVRVVRVHVNRCQRLRDESTVPDELDGCRQVDSRKRAVPERALVDGLEAVAADVNRRELAAVEERAVADGLDGLGDDDRRDAEEAVERLACDGGHRARDSLLGAVDGHLDAIDGRGNLHGDAAAAQVFHDLVLAVAQALVLVVGSVAVAVRLERVVTGGHPSGCGPRSHAVDRVVHSLLVRQAVSASEFGGEIDALGRLALEVHAAVDVRERALGDGFHRVGNGELGDGFRSPVKCAGGNASHVAIAAIAVRNGQVGVASNVARDRPCLGLAVKCHVPVVVEGALGIGPRAVLPRRLLGCRVIDRRALRRTRARRAVGVGACALEAYRGGKPRQGAIADRSDARRNVHQGELSLGGSTAESVRAEARDGVAVDLGRNVDRKGVAPGAAISAALSSLDCGALLNVGTRTLEGHAVAPQVLGCSDVARAEDGGERVAVECVGVGNRHAGGKRHDARSDARRRAKELHLRAHRAGKRVCVDRRDGVGQDDLLRNGSTLERVGGDGGNGKAVDLRGGGRDGACARVAHDRHFTVSRLRVLPVARGQRLDHAEGHLQRSLVVRARAGNHHVVGAGGRDVPKGNGFTRSRFVGDGVVLVRDERAVAVLDGKRRRGHKALEHVGNGNLTSCNGRDVLSARRLRDHRVACRLPERVSGGDDRLRAVGSTRSDSDRAVLHRGDLGIGGSPGDGRVAIDEGGSVLLRLILRREVDGAPDGDLAGLASLVGTFLENLHARRRREELVAVDDFDLADPVVEGIVVGVVVHVLPQTVYLPVVERLHAAPHHEVRRRLGLGRGA